VAADVVRQRCPFSGMEVNIRAKSARQSIQPMADAGLPSHADARFRRGLVRIRLVKPDASHPTSIRTPLAPLSNRRK
jgi:hypothetical protein